MREQELTTLYVDYGHLLHKDDVLADAIQKQYYRFLPYIRCAVHSLVAEFEPEYLKLNPTAAATDSVNLQSREFNVTFYHLPLVSGIRPQSRQNRASEVSPELLYGTFICEVCGGIVNDIEQQFKYTELSLCPNPTCGNQVAWQLQINSSKFTDWQKVRIQENLPEIPTDLCPDPWTLFYVRSSSNEQRQVTNVCSQTHSSSCKALANLDFVEPINQS
ncbi:nucleic acid-binding protein [Laetiporus sulphureus 93-53]|uniref:DNA replication licensing factor MCM6 n=1 Tax=Laetiporus sulphureus 93-53 TaxID=1314785 RepID=A0A165DQR8_9APHY|nr:nucleic acid-binding protein [Laetiporus sulphureus 93-53]KZT05421.1 nucleic acid-binding protein [Laetiporus sulphureus 93-53]